MEQDQAWAAGLFEGEGAILLTNAGTKTAGLRLVVKMTDEDVIRRWAQIVGAKVSGPYQYQQTDGSRRKPFWSSSLSGRRAEAVMAWMEPYLGERRRRRLWEQRTSILDSRGSLFV